MTLAAKTKLPVVDEIECTDKTLKTFFAQLEVQAKCARLAAY